jgi:hypothetical protein
MHGERAFQTHFLPLTTDFDFPFLREGSVWMKPLLSLLSRLFPTFFFVGARQFQSRVGWADRERLPVLVVL